MRSNRKYLIGLFISFLIISGCNTNDSMQPPEVNGSYDSSITVQGVSGEFSVTLRENDGEVSGDGVISTPNATVALEASGTHTHPDISLTFKATGFRDFNLSGEVSGDGDRINGVLNGSALDGVEVTLVRN